MRYFPFFIVIAAGLIIWPLTMGGWQTTALLLTPPPPCNTPTLTPTGASTATPGVSAAAITPTPSASPTLPTCSPTVPPQPCPPYPSPTPTLSPSATPCAIDTPTATPTIQPVFTATVTVIPHHLFMTVGQILSITVSLAVSEGCQLPVYELTVSQTAANKPPFAPADSIVLGPGVSLPKTITMTAVTTGTATIHAQVYGERNCGDGWMWTYVNGVSLPVNVGKPFLWPYKLYLPLMRQEE